MWLTKEKLNPSEKPGKTHIIKVILIVSIILLTWGDIFILKSSLIGGNSQHHVGLILFTSILGVMVFSLHLLKRGYSDLASYIIIFVFFMGTSYGAYRWGSNLPAVLLGYAIVVVCFEYIAELKSESSYDIA